MNVFIKSLLLTFVLCIACCLVPLNARAVDDTWQVSAQGLKDGTDSQSSLLLRYRLLGNSIQLQAPQGAEPYSIHGWQPEVINYFPFSLGDIRVPGATIDSVHRFGDWSGASAEIAFSNSDVVKLYASQLSPAIALETTGSTLRLFAGIKLPKFVAQPKAAAGMTVFPLTKALTPANTGLSWLVVWWADANLFYKTTTPLNHGPGGPFHSFGGIWSTDAQPGDIPLLLGFSQLPTSVNPSVEGLSLSFANKGARIVVVPFTGQGYPGADTTQKWATTFPVEVESRIRSIAPYFQEYPIRARESFNYDNESDEGTFTESIDFLEINSNGAKKLAPLPPIVGVAMQMGLSSPFLHLTNLDIPTAYGPLLGVEGADEYSYSVSGLSSYVTYKEPDGRVAGYSDIFDELTIKVGEMIDAGLLSPFALCDKLPKSVSTGELYWAEPGEELYLLSELYPVLDSVMKARLKAYVTAVYADRPPEFQAMTQHGTSTIRGLLDCGTLGIAQAKIAERSNVMLFSLYGLSRYADLSGNKLSSDSWNAAKRVLLSSFEEQDWATLFNIGNYGEIFNWSMTRSPSKYWHNDYRTVVVKTNRDFAGALGAIRLSQQMHDQDAEQQAWWRFSRASILRYAIGKLPEWYYTTNMNHLPSDPKWYWNLIRNASDKQSSSCLQINSWSRPIDDIRQVVELSQDYVTLANCATNETSTYWFTKELLPFRFMVPELGLFIANHLKEETRSYTKAVALSQPFWYAKLAEATIGEERGIMLPSDSFQVFLAYSQIMQVSPDQLIQWIDVPWVEKGDLFYLNKLAEAIKIKNTPNSQKIRITMFGEYRPDTYLYLPLLAFSQNSSN